MVLWLASALTVGCGNPVYYTPDFAGVVRHNENQPNRTHVFTMTDGRVFEVDLESRPIVYGAGLPNARELLLAGEVPKPWVARLPGREPCFEIGGSGREDGNHIATAAGLRLPKAANFDRADYHETEHEFHRGGFCVNAAGEITGFR
jgi:hypothetical protein